MLWAANELLAVFAPAFHLSLLRQEIRPQPAQAHSLATLGASERKNDPSLAPEKIMELRFLNQKEHDQESDYFPPFDLLFDVEC